MNLLRVSSSSREVMHGCLPQRKIPSVTNETIRMLFSWSNNFKNRQRNAPLFSEFWFSWAPPPPHLIPWNPSPRRKNCIPPNNKRRCLSLPHWSTKNYSEHRSEQALFLQISQPKFHLELKGNTLLILRKYFTSPLSALNLLDNFSTILPQCWGIIRMVDENCWH